MFRTFQAGRGRETEAEIKQLIQEAIEFHLEDRTESGTEVPPPKSKSAYVEFLAG